MFTENIKTKKPHTAELFAVAEILVIHSCFPLLC